MNGLELAHLNRRWSLRSKARRKQSDANSAERIEGFTGIQRSRRYCAVRIVAVQEAVQLDAPCVVLRLPAPRTPGQRMTQHPKSLTLSRDADAAELCFA
jgi:hypothetical protein